MFDITISVKTLVIIVAVSAILSVGGWVFFTRQSYPRREAVRKIYNEYTPAWVKILIDAIAPTAAYAQDPFVDVETDCTVQSEKKPSGSQFESIGHDVFTSIITDHGGDSSAVLRNVRLPAIRNPESNRKLEFDSYYAEGVHKIAVEYHGEHHTSFPNSFHRSRREFEAQLQRDIAKADAARRERIYLINVPYHIDRCVKDENEPSGWRLDPSITIEERRGRIDSYLRSAIEKYYNDLK